MRCIGKLLVPGSADHRVAMGALRGRIPLQAQGNERRFTICVRIFHHSHDWSAPLGLPITIWLRSQGAMRSIPARYLSLRMRRET
jgi:hypothetical protein